MDGAGWLGVRWYSRLIRLLIFLLLLSSIGGIYPASSQDEPAPQEPSQETITGTITEEWVQDFPNPEGTSRYTAGYEVPAMLTINNSTTIRVWINLTELAGTVHLVTFDGMVLTINTSEGRSTVRRSSYVIHFRGDEIKEFGQGAKWGPVELNIKVPNGDQGELANVTIVIRFSEITFSREKVPRELAYTLLVPLVAPKAPVNMALEVNPPSLVVERPITISTILTDEANKPLEGFILDFFVSGEKIGRAMTDEKGVASLSYTPEAKSILEVKVVFPGNDLYSAVSKSASLTVLESDPADELSLMGISLLSIVAVLASFVLLVRFIEKH